MFIGNAQCGGWGKLIQVLFWEGLAGLLAANAFRFADPGIVLGFALAGGNGTGKSTLLKIGMEKLDYGSSVRVKTITFQ